MAATPYNRDDNRRAAIAHVAADAAVSLLVTVGLVLAPISGRPWLETRWPARSPPW